MVLFYIHGIAYFVGLTMKAINYVEKKEKPTTRIGRTLTNTQQAEIN